MSGSAAGSPRAGIPTQPMAGGTDGGAESVRSPPSVPPAISAADVHDDGRRASATDTSPYECNICLEVAQEPVVTFCGHLYCWTCLYRWMRNGHNVCPVCKSGVSRETVIPLFGRGGERVDPRAGPHQTSGTGAGAGSAAAGGGGGGGSGSDSARAAGGAGAGGDAAAAPPGGAPDAVPSRPAPQRTDPPPQAAGGAGEWAGGAGGGAAAGFVTAGFGFFPSLFALQFHSIAPAPRQPGAPPLTPDEAAQLLHSRLVFAIGAGVVLFLLFL